MFKTVLEDIQLTDTYQSSKSINNINVNSKLILYVNYTKGNEDGLLIRVGFTEDDNDFYHDIENNVIKEYSITDAGKYRLIIEFPERFSRVYVKGSGAAIDGSVSVLSKVIPIV